MCVCVCVCVCVCKVLLNTTDSLFGFDDQVKTSQQFQYSSYFCVEMVVKKSYISPSAFDYFVCHPRG